MMIPFVSHRFSMIYGHLLSFRLMSFARHLEDIVDVIFKYIYVSYIFGNRHARNSFKWERTCE